jgi:chromosome segregation ATPase
VETAERVGRLQQDLAFKNRTVEQLQRDKRIVTAESIRRKQALSQQGTQLNNARLQLAEVSAVKWRLEKEIEKLNRNIRQYESVQVSLLERSSRLDRTVELLEQARNGFDQSQSQVQQLAAEKLSLTAKIKGQREHILVLEPKLKECQIVIDTLRSTIAEKDSALNAANKALNISKNVLADKSAKLSKLNEVIDLHLAEKVRLMGMLGDLRQQFLEEQARYNHGPQKELHTAIEHLLKRNKELEQLIQKLTSNQQI